MIETRSEPFPKLQFSRTEAAELLGISERTLDRLIAEKELRAPEEAH